MEMLVAEGKEEENIETLPSEVPSTRSRVLFRGAAVFGALALVLLVVGLSALSLQKATPVVADELGIVDEYDGSVHTIKQKSSGRYLDAFTGGSYGWDVVTRPKQRDETQKWIFTQVDGNVYTIQQKVTRRFLDAYEHYSWDYKAATRPAQNNDSQKWVITRVDGDTYTIKHKVNGRYLDAYQVGGYRVATRTWQGDSTQQWEIAPGSLPA